jgi:hypothetical protein
MFSSSLAAGAAVAFFCLAVFGRRFLRSADEVMAVALALLVFLCEFGSVTVFAFFERHSSRDSISWALACAVTASVDRVTTSPTATASSFRFRFCEIIVYREIEARGARRTGC